MFAQACPRCHSPRVQRGYNPSPLVLQAICIYELLCNNCSFEFRGLAIPGLVRRTPSTRRERPGNKQQAPRFKVRVPLNVAVIEGNIYTNDIRYSPPLEGYTRNISKVGLAFILPQLIVQAYNFADPARRLWVQLTLPNGAVDISVAPVRHEQLKVSDRDDGWLIGARITKISEGNRSRLAEYLQTLA